MVALLLAAFSLGGFCVLMLAVLMRGEIEIARSERELREEMQAKRHKELIDKWMQGGHQPAGPTNPLAGPPMEMKF